MRPEVREWTVHVRRISGKDLVGPVCSQTRPTLAAAPAAAAVAAVLKRPLEGPQSKQKKRKRERTGERKSKTLTLVRSRGFRLFWTALCTGFLS